MPYEQWKAEQEFLAKAEERVFIQQGLGWLVQFMHDVQNSKIENNDNIRGNSFKGTDDRGTS